MELLAYSKIIDDILPNIVAFSIFAEVHLMASITPLPSIILSIIFKFALHDEESILPTIDRLTEIFNESLLLILSWLLLLSLLLMFIPSSTLFPNIPILYRQT